MKVTWQVEDGYVGESRSHTTEIPDDEIGECETREELMELIEGYVQNDFEQTISWCLSGMDDLFSEFPEENT